MSTIKTYTNVTVENKMYKIEYEGEKGRAWVRQPDSPASGMWIDATEKSLAQLIEALKDLRSELYGPKDITR